VSNGGRRWQREVLPLRIVVDVNVWVAHALAAYFGKSTRSAASRIIDIVRSAKMGGRPAQVVVSLEMVDNIERVLVQLGLNNRAAHDVATAAADLAKAGPEQQDAHLLLSGRDELGISSREDAGVLALAVAAKANLLITSNLKHFVTNDGDVIETQIIRAGTGTRQLFTVLHERSDDVSLVIAHPVDVLDWLRDELEIAPASIRWRYGHKRAER
jgi:predicted nucleic acid-binding protein